MFDIPTAISSLSTLADTVVKRIWPDATEIEKAKLERVAAEMQNEFNLVLGQLEINKIEAGADNIFVSGWRPFVGWIGGISFAYVSILEPLLRFVATVFFGYLGIYPVIDTSLTIQVLFGLLGLGALRTYEKKIGVSSK